MRSYDPQIGRFLQNDPYDQFASGYVGMGNDPANLTDKDGGCAGCAVQLGNLINTLAKAGGTLQTVEVIGSLAKVGAKAKSVANLLKITTAINDFKEVLSSQLWNLSGGAAAVLDNFTGGLTNLRSAMAPDAATNPNAASAFRNGEFGGHVASMILAMFEGYIGDGLAAGGGFVTVGSGGLLGEFSVPATGLGIGMMWHSGIFYGTAQYNLMNWNGQVKFEGNEPADQEKFEQATPENTGNKNLQDYKKINGNESANKAAGEAGYKDAHELKKKTLGKKAKVSRYDMYKNNKTGELELRTKDEKQRVPVKKLK